VDLNPLALRWFPWSRLAMSQAYSPLAGWVYFGGLSTLSFVVAAISALGAVALPQIFQKSSKKSGLKVLALVLSIGFWCP